SLPKPPTQTAVESPIVSAADTRKTTTSATIALILNCGTKGINFGIAINSLCVIGVKSIIPINIDNMYPTISPNNIDNCFQKPFAKTLNDKQEIKVIVPTITFCAEPKSTAPFPPPKEAAPTPSSEKPIDVTTQADTIGDINLLQ